MKTSKYSISISNAKTGDWKARFYVDAKTDDEAVEKAKDFAEHMGSIDYVPKVQLWSRTKMLFCRIMWSLDISLKEVGSDYER